MEWLQTLDVAAFRFVNQTLSNPVFDRIMPFFSWNPFFIPLVVLAFGLLIWKGGVKGRLCVAFLLLAVAIGDGWICNSLKEAIGRLRPFHEVPDVNLLVGKGKSFSLPSAHSANWFSATAVLFLFYRRSLPFMLPLAILVGFSRIYNGVHYPGDVLAGALLGVAYGAGFVLGADWVWKKLGSRWFPSWWARMPSLRNPPAASQPKPADSDAVPDRKPRNETQWLRLGYVVIVLILLARWGYLASGKIELSEDEAYQWLWSQHPALSYYSKPPMIAYTQWLGTNIWGDTEFGIRFFSPLIAAILSFLLLRFLHCEGYTRGGFWLVFIASATPLLAVGSTLLTIDPLSVLFWTAAMLSGWKAVQQDSTRHWLWAGLWMGMGFLSKYTGLFQLLCWAVFFALWKPARAQLRRPGPWLALGINLLCTIPVIVWNAQNDWITVTHLEERGGLDREWTFSLRFFWDFIFVEPLLLNPVFFLAALWAAVAIWRKGEKKPLQIYLFSMGAPLFLFYFLYTLRARVQPNWIAPSVIPLFCLMVIYWHEKWRAGAVRVKHVLGAGLALGLTAVLLLHDTNLINKLAGFYLPPSSDPLRRVRSWSETARIVGEAREKLAEEGRPVFIIGNHYGLTSLIAFYLPEAKAGVPHNPMVYYRSTERPVNQFYFWPGYKERKGQNALFVMEVKDDKGKSVPDLVQSQFASVSSMGVFEVKYRGRIFHKIQIFACRDLQ